MNTHKLRQKIAETCPEIMELSMGCKIHHNGTIGILIRKTPDLEDRDYYDVWWNKSTNSIRSYHIDDLEIIGHPVRLSHVLRAMTPLWTMDRFEIDVIKFNNSVEVKSVIYETEIEKVLFSWNLTKDSLEDQSEKTQRFVASLLNVTLE